MGLGKLPGESFIKVNCTTGPSSYTRGGFNVRVDIGEITKDEDILGVYCDNHGYNPQVSGFSGNKVIVIVGYGRDIRGAFAEVSSATDLSGTTFCAVGKRGGF